MNARLKAIFKNIPEERLTFLAKLEESEQEELAKIVHTVLESEGSGLIAGIAFVSHIIPSFLKAKIAQEMMGPATTAKMAYHLPAKQILGTLNSLKPEFLADVALHLEPEKIVEIIDQSPDHLLDKITNILISREQYTVLASFADHISMTKLNVIAKRVHDNQAMVEIARNMSHQNRIVQVSLSFPNERLIALMQVISHFEYYELAAAVGQEYPIDRQLDLLNGLGIMEAARLAAHYQPEVIAEILEKIEMEKAVEIAMHLDAEHLGELTNILTVEQLNRFIPYINVSHVEKALEFVNRHRVEGLWSQLSDGVQNILKDASKKDSAWNQLIQKLIKM